MATYKNNIQKGQSPAQMQSLAQQINNLAKSLGQTVNLPKPSTSSTSTSSSIAVAAQTSTNQSATGKLPPGYA
jgi:hypothetical protein